VGFCRGDVDHCGEWGGSRKAPFPVSTKPLLASVLHSSLGVRFIQTYSVLKEKNDWWVTGYRCLHRPASLAVGLLQVGADGLGKKNMHWGVRCP
jgi:hypothetical protein